MSLPKKNIKTRGEKDKNKPLLFKGQPLFFSEKLYFYQQQKKMQMLKKRVIVMISNLNTTNQIMSSTIQLTTRMAGKFKDVLCLRCILFIFTLHHTWDAVYFALVCYVEIEDFRLSLFFIEIGWVNR